MMNTISNINVLLIEDDLADAQLVEELLSEHSHFQFKVDCAQNMDEATELFKKRTYTIVLLDLYIGKTNGLDTLNQMLELSSNVPIVVLTGLEDEEVASKAIRESAQDYLVKGELNSNVLTRSIVYAVERHKLQREIKKMDLKRQQERDRAETVRSYNHFYAISKLNIKESRGAGLDEHTLNSLISDYRDITLKYIHAVRIKEEKPSEAVKMFASKLASLRIRARDIIRLHLKVLNNYSQRAMPDADRAFSNDARLFLVELMGNILDIYCNVHLKEINKED